MKKQLAAALLTTGLVSCATVPAPLQGQYSNANPRDALNAHASGAVRWGGEIVKVEPKADSTCFEIVERELDSSARPRSHEATGGRFIACHAGFYDPEDFQRGRELTVVGQVTGTDHGKVGEFDYAYPHVAADAIYLWPRRVAYSRSSYYDPWMYGYGPYGFGLGFGPYWGGPYWGGPIIIHQHHHSSTPPPAPQSRAGH